MRKIIDIKEIKRKKNNKSLMKDKATTPENILKYFGIEKPKFECKLM